MSDLKKYSDDYLNILETEFKGLNLTRILESEEFYNKQILDSVDPYMNHASIRTLFDESETIVDIGFGGGFPLLPMAKLLPEKLFLGFEARGKKAIAVSRIAELLGQKNVRCFHQRLENIMFNTTKTLITFKAVGRVDKFLELVYTDKKDLKVLFYKGPSFDLEEREAALNLKHWDLSLEVDYKVSGTIGRKILVFKPRNVLRGTQKKLVNLSQIISNKSE